MLPDDREPPEPAPTEDAGTAAEVQDATVSDSAAEEPGESAAAQPGAIPDPDSPGKAVISDAADRIVASSLDP